MEFVTFAISATSLCEGCIAIRVRFWMCARATRQEIVGTIGFCGLRAKEGGAGGGGRTRTALRPRDFESEQIANGTVGRSCK
jgi:hypothetical protein